MTRRLALILASGWALILASGWLWAPFAFGVAIAAPADGPVQSIQVTGAFARGAPAGGVGGLFLTIVNTGSADRLTGAASPAVGKAELHESIQDKGVMKMRPVAVLDIPAGGTVQLAPGGYHVMLMGLKQSLTAGGQLPATLSFEKAGRIEITATVVKAGAGAPSGPNMGHGMGHDMGHMPGMAPVK